MQGKRSVLDALKESPFANCTLHKLPWGVSFDYAAFECPKGCLWAYQDSKLNVEYLDSL